jgi:acyl-CoA synthetase (AMP-forming)/AMP-acid ligase II
VNLLLDILEHRAKQTPQKTAFNFYNEPPCTYRDLWQGIDRTAAYFLEQGLRAGDPVIIAVPNSREFFYVFYGVQRAGGIAVPVFPGSGTARILKLTDLCAAVFLVVPETFPLAKVTKLKQGTLSGRRRVLFAGETMSVTQTRSFPEVLPETISFIQFTSGSVGNPKGVKITHANVLTNLEQMIAGMAITQEDVFVNWLPVYHDMGLILMTMVPFYLGIPLVLLPTGLNYLKSWLRAVQEYGGTFTAAPDFAYRLCLVYIRDPENYDLASLRVALNAAEPVRSGTIKRFEETFRLRHVMLPAYGLAEATVGVCSWKPGEKIKTDHRGFVSVGKPFPGVDMRVVRDSGHKPAAPADTGKTGEILVKSEAGTSGYFNNPKATKELFGEGGYIRTGDLGYVDAEGDFFIVGHKKNIIIQGGYNIAAREVEEWVDELSFVRRSAAVGIDRGNTEGEQVYIFIEVKLDRSQMHQEEVLTGLIVDVVQRFHLAFGFRPGRVYLLKPRAIPITFNGKIKYLQLKEEYVSGTLMEKGLILLPEY